MISIQSLAERLSKATNNTNTYSEGLFDLKSDWLESLYYFEELILAEICYDLDVPDTFGELQALHSRMEIKDESMKNLAWIVLHDRYFSTQTSVYVFILKILLLLRFYMYMNQRTCTLTVHFGGWYTRKTSYEKSKDKSKTCTLCSPKQIHSS